MCRIPDIVSKRCEKINWHRRDHEEKWNVMVMATLYWRYSFLNSDDESNWCSIGLCWIQNSILIERLIWMRSVYFRSNGLIETISRKVFSILIDLKSRRIEASHRDANRNDFCLVLSQPSILLLIYGWKNLFHWPSTIHVIVFAFVIQSRNTPIDSIACGWTLFY